MAKAASRPVFSVYLPVYNEEKVLEKNVMRVDQALHAIGKPYEIIIVDDNSTDKSSAIAKRLARKKSIRALRYENGPSRRENQGRAFAEAKGDIIAFMDIDLATDLKDLSLLLTSVYSKKWDVAIGSRYIHGAVIKRLTVRRIYSWCYNTAIRMLFDSRIDDHQCGFKAYRKSVVMDLLNRMGYDSSFKRGWFWDAEMMIRAQKQGLHIRELPVVWTRGAKTSFSFKREIKVIPYMIGFRFRLWGGK